MSLTRRSGLQVVGKLLSRSRTALVLVDDPADRGPQVAAGLAVRPVVHAAILVRGIGAKRRAAVRIGIVQVDGQASLGGVVDHAGVDVGKAPVLGMDGGAGAGGGFPRDGVLICPEGG